MLLNLPVAKEKNSKDLTPMEMAPIVAAGCAGTAIEWYDYFLFANLSTTLSSKFFNTGTPSGDTIAWISVFAIGFIARPAGACFFGSLGDTFGRKRVFIACLIVMGLSTVAIGCLPTRETIGPLASFLLVLLRIIQGLCIGGEYGGAAANIGECSPAKSRGFYTSFLNAMGTVGLITSSAAVLIARLSVGEEKFDDWGWRMPFLFSSILLLLSLLISKMIKESVLYEKLRKSGNICKKPLKEAITDKTNLYYISVALFGYLLGLQCLSMTVSVYVQTFIEVTLKTESKLSFYLMTVSFASIVPIFVLAGYLSDRVGRKTIIIAGFLSSIITFYPIFLALSHYGPFEDPNAPILVVNPNYSPGMLSILIGSMNAMFALTNGPGTSLLVELFPTRIRYTSLSISYHLSAGIFGGLMPVIAVLAEKVTGNVYAGLWYPITAMLVSLVICCVFIPETSGKQLD